MVKKFGMLSLVMAVFALVCAGSALAEGERYATIGQMKGEVLVRFDHSGEWKPAQVGMKLNQMGEIKTGNNATAEIHLDQNAETGKFDVKENSLVRLASLERDAVTGDKTTLLDLAIGKVIVKAEKLEGDSKFEVRTPTSTTGVRGTVFEVSVAKEA